MKKLTLYIAVSIFALVATEVFLHAILPSVIEKDLWFTSGIHTPDEKYGYVFTKNYNGVMRHRDNVYFTPLQLDENGFRKPATGSQYTREIVLIGGASMTFSYGVDDDQTIHHYISKDVDIPSKVYNTAWPGIGLYRNFHVYKDLIEDRINPELVIFCIYGVQSKNFATYPEIGETYYNQYKHLENLFLYNSSHVLRVPKNKIALWLGKYYYRSLLIFKILKFVEKVEFKLALMFDDSGKTKSLEENLDQDKGDRKFKEWFHYLNNHFRKSKILFVFMPMMYKDRDYYSHLISLIPDRKDYIDIHKIFPDLDGDKNWVGNGHYSQEATKFIGKIIASKINNMGTLPTLRHVYKIENK